MTILPFKNLEIGKESRNQLNHQNLGPWDPNTLFRGQISGLYFDVYFNLKILLRKNRYLIWRSFYLDEFNCSNYVEKTGKQRDKSRKKTGKQRKQKGGNKNGEKNRKNNEQQNHQNRLAIFILVGCYYFDPGVGDLYFWCFF